MKYIRQTLTAMMSPQVPDVVNLNPDFSAVLASRRAVLNMGGIANLTLLDDNPQCIRGFDTGPGNCLLDRLTRRLSAGKLAYDVDGHANGPADRGEPLTSVNTFLDFLQNFLRCVPLSLISQVVRMTRFVWHDPPMPLVD